MIFRHRKCKILPPTLLTFLICLPHTVLSLAPAPFDYLVPPPLPQTNAAVTRFTHASPQNLLISESRTIPKFIYPQVAAKPNDKHPGLMTRVARWFGFANQNAVTDQQLTSESNKDPYYYQKPQQQQQYIKGDKEYCFLCNTYPWVPMMQNSVQYPPADNQWDASKQSQVQTYAQNYVSNGNTKPDSYNSIDGQQQQILKNSYGAATGSQAAPQILHASSNLKQRAVKFNFPLPFVPPPKPNNVHDNQNQIQYSTGPFLPILLPPQLNNFALPPLYNAQNFLPPITPVPNAIQELPSSEQALFAENIAEHSEIHIDTAIPTKIPRTTTANKDASFEIVKSHQLVDYISSVEYPASYVPSHSYDISTPESTGSVKQQEINSNVNTGHYQHSTFSPYLSQHVPASQILTEPGSFVAAANQQEYEQQTDVTEQTTVSTNQPQPLESDNYVAASQKNSSILEQPHQQPQLQHHTNLDAWTLESNDFIYATSTPETFSIIGDTSTFTTELGTTTQPQIQNNEIEFIASIQTNAQQPNKESPSAWPLKSKQRETPKRLLDSPIQHVKGNLGAPRPFTRDPSELTFRLSAVNHKLSDTNQATSSRETSKPLQTTATESPVYSSTFSSIDASGQYAGMSPPSLLSSYNNDRIVLPYLTTKIRPRPFESTGINVVTKPPAASSHSTWNQTPNAELHTPEESMLVRSHIKPAVTSTTSTSTTATPRTTKYLTKILASNLRELLQREHEPTKLKSSPNSLDIDINKLQKNIDDWTEQEYTSLSHRPSTPTIRGRSKHIPFEYLPTTTAPVKATRQSKTTKNFSDNSELPSSINNLEPLYERGSTKHYQYTQITDNHLKDFYTNFESLNSQAAASYRASTTQATPAIKTTTMASTTTKSSTPTTPTTTTTRENALYLRPLPIQEPEELWKKAKVSISPKTQEKVYVVTPQPRFSPQRFYSPTAEPSSLTTTTTERSLSSFRLGSGFKSPRFLVRPTPGNDTQTKETSKEITNSSLFSPEWFGLKVLSAYVPAEPVEIIDGNSKVLNIVTTPRSLENTASHNIMDLTKDRHLAAKRKATMAPSPR